jgi:hypothetical protein
MKNYKFLTILCLSIIFSCSENSSSDSGGSSSLTPNYAYVTSNNSLKIIDITNVNNLTMSSSISLSTPYYVSVSPNVAYVAQYDATAPYISLINISNPLSPTLATAIPKDNTLAFSFLSDMYTIQGVGYLTDLFRGVHVIDLINSNFSSQVNQGSDAMSITKIMNTLFVIDQANGLHSIDISNPSNLTLTGVSNTTDIDIASYPDAPYGNYHSWVENDGTYIYVANIFDKKIKKFDANTLTLLNDVSIEGYTTAFAIKNGIGYVTTKASANAPLQTSFDGIKMIDLNTMSILDAKPLNGASGVALNDDSAYITDTNGLHVYDVSSGSLILQSTLATGNGNYIALGE